jgi:hypothetical protein
MLCTYLSPCQFQGGYVFLLRTANNAVVAGKALTDAATGFVDRIGLLNMYEQIAL